MELRQACSIKLQVLKLEPTFSKQMVKETIELRNPDYNTQELKKHIKSYLPVYFLVIKFVEYNHNNRRISFFYHLCQKISMTS